jgi:hypothetical protein|nr:MAG TPA: homing endonuclease [Caudoviricetes sp.]
MEEYGVFEVVEKLNERAPDGHQLWKIRCKECGREFIRGSNLVKAPSKITYNCFHKRFNGQDVNYDNRWKNQRIKAIYYKIITRCYNEDNKDYRFYGAKGISVYQDWLDNPIHFEEWALANGYEDNLTIDRKNETKDYSPDNCRWITMEENARWKSTTNRIDVDGEIKSGQQWAKYLGFSQNVINTYIRKYGIDNVIEFIRRYKANPYKGPLPNRTSYYALYMEKDSNS